MKDPSMELQNAAYARLKTGAAAIAYPVYDYGRVPKNLAVDYISIGDVHSVPWNSKGNPGTDTVLTFHIWSNVKGKQYVNDMKNAILESITVTDDMAASHLSLTSFNVVRQDFDNSDTPFEDPSGAYHGVLTMSFLLQQK